MSFFNFSTVFLTAITHEKKPTDMVDGSNESLLHANDRMELLLRNFQPWKTIFNNFDVITLGKRK